MEIIICKDVLTITEVVQVMNRIRKLQHSKITNVFAGCVISRKQEACGCSGVLQEIRVCNVT